MFKLVFQKDAFTGKARKTFQFTVGMLRYLLWDSQICFCPGKIISLLSHIRCGKSDGIIIFNIIVECGSQCLSGRRPSCCPTQNWAIKHSKASLPVIGQAGWEHRDGGNQLLILSPVKSICGPMLFSQSTHDLKQIVLVLLPLKETYTTVFLFMSTAISFRTGNLPISKRKGSTQAWRY